VSIWDENRPFDNIIIPPGTVCDNIPNYNAISAIIKDNEGKILILKHVQLELWTIPSEKVGKNQPIEVALKFNMQRDLNILIRDYIEVNTFSHNYLIGKDVVNMIQHQFLILEYKGELENNKRYKYERLKWLDIEDLRNFRDITLVTREYIRYLANKDDKK